MSILDKEELPLLMNFIITRIRTLRSGFLSFSKNIYDLNQKLTVSLYSVNNADVLSTLDYMDGCLNKKR